MHSWDKILLFWLEPLISYILFTVSPGIICLVSKIFCDGLADCSLKALLWTAFCEQNWLIFEFTFLSFWFKYILVTVFIISFWLLIDSFLFFAFRVFW